MKTRPQFDDKDLNREILHKNYEKYFNAYKYIEKKFLYYVITVLRIILNHIKLYTSSENINTFKLYKRISIYASTAMLKSDTQGGSTTCDAKKSKRVRERKRERPGDRGKGEKEREKEGRKKESKRKKNRRRGL